MLITGLPLSGMESTLHKVEIAELVAFSAALVLAGIIGTGFVRLSLRPLTRVAATATRVTQLPLASGEVTLGERVPDTSPRTEVGRVAEAFNRMLGHVEGALARRAASEGRDCAGSPPTPATSCAPRWPPSAATRSSRCESGRGSRRHRARAAPGGVGVGPDECAG